MKELRSLRQFIRDRLDDGAVAEVRAYALESVEALADAFDTDVDAFCRNVARYAEDEQLARALLKDTETKLAEPLMKRRVERASDAQVAADALAQIARATRAGEYAMDVRLLFGALMTPASILVFSWCGERRFAIRMRPLLALRALKKEIISVTIDARAIRIRWKTGGLNLAPMDPRDVAFESARNGVLYVNLPAVASSASVAA